MHCLMLYVCVCVCVYVCMYVCMYVCIRVYRKKILSALLRNEVIPLSSRAFDICDNDFYWYRCMSIYILHFIIYHILFLSRMF